MSSAFSRVSRSFKKARFLRVCSYFKARVFQGVFSYYFLIPDAWGVFLLFVSSTPDPQPESMGCALGSKAFIESKSQEVKLLITSAPNKAISHY